MSSHQPPPVPFPPYRPVPPRPPRPEIALGSPLRWTLGLLAIVVAVPTVIAVGGLTVILLWYALLDPNFTAGEAFSQTWDWSVYGVADNAVGLSVLIGSVLVVAVAALVVGRSSRAVRTWEPLWQAAAAAFAGATLGLFFGALVLAIVYA